MVFIESQHKRKQCEYLVQKISFFKKYVEGNEKSDHSPLFYLSHRFAVH